MSSNSPSVSSPRASHEATVVVDTSDSLVVVASHVIMTGRVQFLEENSMKCKMRGTRRRNGTTNIDSGTEGKEVCLKKIDPSKPKPLPVLV